MGMMLNKYTGLEIAIIGIAGKFPGAKDVFEFWENIKRGKECLTHFSEAELKDDGVDERLINSAAYIRSAMVLEEKGYFDSNFFNYAPQEAAIMTPHARMLHECVWTAIEDAGIYDDIKNVPVALIAGASANFEWQVHSKLMGPNDNVDSFRSSILSTTKYMNTLVAYNLDLKGPAIYIDTACSTSLTGVHLACRSLLTGDAKIAIAGGVTINSRRTQGYLYQQEGALSEDGHCKAFNSNASGTIGGEGAAFVVLKKLQDAINDGDRIYSIIKGSAINNDGRRKVGFTAPSIDGQSECIRIAHRMAKVASETIGYIEAHGSGTKLGDPIELMALKKAFDNGKEFSAALATVKSNIGHLDAAAGTAGLLRAVLSIWHKTIPPAVYSNDPLPDLKWGTNGFYLNAELKPWPQKDNLPLRAGISSFGFGGTNAHLVLEEAPQQKIADKERKYNLLTISAQTENSLSQFQERLTAFLSGSEGLNLSDVCYTLQTARKQYDYRKSFVFEDRQGLLKLLQADSSHSYQRSKSRKDSVVFLFSGLGSQYQGMCQHLYENEPLFTQYVNECFQYIKSIAGIDLQPLLYPSQPLSPNHDAYSQIDIGQYLVFTIEYSLAKLLMEWGVQPDYMVGYSFGEYVAACISGVFSLQDAIKIVCKRAELIMSTTAGLMLSIPLTRKEIKPLLNNDISLSIDNGPSCVVSGSKTAIIALERTLKDQRLMVTYLNANHAVHSHLMDPILENLKLFIQTIQINKPAIPYISNVTGDWITIEDITDSDYWARHLRQTVEFSTAIERLTIKKNLLCIEIGTGNEISALVNRVFESKGIDAIAINMVRPENNNISDYRYLLNRLGYLWSLGINVDWKSYYQNDSRQKLSLPTYCFEKIQYQTEVNLAESVIKGFHLPDSSSNTEPWDWIYYPIWKKSFIESSSTVDKRCYVIFSLEHAFTSMLKQMLAQRGDEVIEVMIGSGFERVSTKKFIIHPAQLDDYKLLFKQLEQEGMSVTDIVHTWSMGVDQLVAPLYEDAEALDWIYFSIQKIIKGLLYVNNIDGKHISVLTDRLHKVLGDEEMSYSSSLVLGIINVLPQEFNVTCSNIDINLSERTNASFTKLAAEIQNRSSERVIAIRNGNRWLLDYQKVANPIRENAAQLKKGGVYLVTGGLGKIGYVLVQYLLKEYQAKVVILGRSKPGPEINQKLNSLKEISSDVTYFSVDIASILQLREVKSDIEATIGPVCGIIHAAGIIDHSYYELIEDLTINKSLYLFSPKLRGIENIYKLYKDAALDFVWITSSLAAIVGGLSYASYSAANLFMDYFLLSKEKELPNWKCIDLGALDLASDVNNTGNLKQTHLSANDICRLFEWSLSVKDQGLLIVTKGDLHKIINGIFASRKRSYLKTDFHVEQIRKIERPNLVNDYKPPITSMQKRIVEMIEYLFGIGEIGIEDNFFELGGDSLKALVLIRRIKSELNVSLSVNDIFKQGNAEQIAALVEDVQSVLVKSDRGSKIII